MLSEVIKCNLIKKKKFKCEISFKIVLDKNFYIMWTLIGYKVTLNNIIQVGNL